MGTRPSTGKWAGRIALVSRNQSGSETTRWARQLCVPRPMATDRKVTLTLDDVNQLGFREFTERFGGVIEQTPLVAAAAWSSRPFRDLQALHGAFSGFVRTLSFEGKAAVLRCHPDLAGKLAQEGGLSPESTKEQRSAGMLALSYSEREELVRLNGAYVEKFTVPFVICARENKKEAIFVGIRRRLGNTVQEEVEAGVEEVVKIAWYRLTGIVTEGSAKL